MSKVRIDESEAAGVADVGLAERVPTKKEQEAVGQGAGEEDQYVRRCGRRRFEHPSIAVKAANQISPTGTPKSRGDRRVASSCRSTERKTPTKSTAKTIGDCCKIPNRKIGTRMNVCRP